MTSNNDAEVTRLEIPQRKPGDIKQANPSQGCQDSQLSNARKMSIARYGHAYRELAKH